MANSDLLDRPHPDLTTGYHHAPNEDARELAARGGREAPEEPTVDGHNIRGAYQYVRGGGAAGAVQSTVPDMAHYASALLRRGAGIVRPETFDAMVAPQWCPNDRLESWGTPSSASNASAGASSAMAAASSAAGAACCWSCPAPAAP